MKRMTSAPKPNDSSTEALALQLQAFREMSPQERLRKMWALSSQVRQMAFAAIRRRHPDLHEDQVQLRFIELAYGTGLAAEIARWKTERLIESVE